jgi:D-sedoheptulose 7-phosphate isomerase
MSRADRLHIDLAAHVDAVSGTVTGSVAAIDALITHLIISFRAGGKLLACGNGGSAADAQHFVAEFMNRMRVDSPPWPAIALSTDTSVMTSISNDAAFDDVFSRQVEALGQPGDVLVAFSTSGGSANVVAALAAGRARGMTTVAFTGRIGSTRLADQCDVVVVVPSDDTARIQEAHEFVYHVVADAVEATLMTEAATVEETRMDAHR